MTPRQLLDGLRAGEPVNLLALQRVLRSALAAVSARQLAAGTRVEAHRLRRWLLPDATPTPADALAVVEYVAAHLLPLDFLPAQSAAELPERAPGTGGV